MHTIQLTPAELNALRVDFSPEVLDRAIAYLVGENRDEEWQMLNDGLSDENIVRSIAMLATTSKNVA